MPTTSPCNFIADNAVVAKNYTKCLVPHKISNIKLIKSVNITNFTLTIYKSYPPGTDVVKINSSIKLKPGQNPSRIDKNTGELHVFTINESYFILSVYSKKIEPYTSVEITFSWSIDY